MGCSGPTRSPFPRTSKSPPVRLKPPDKNPESAPESMLNTCERGNKRSQATYLS